MIVKFHKIILEGFMSFGSAEVVLDNPGYTLVAGVNKNPADAALSNGSGKCFGAGTKVLMHNGTIKSVEDIQVGDLVMGPDSTPRKVLEIHSGTDKLYKVASTKTDNYSYICNGAHELNLFQTCGFTSFKSIPNELALSVNEYLTNPKYQHSFRRYYNQRITTGVEFNTHNELPIDPYILGLWLGDGSAEAAQICSADPEIVDAIYDFANSHNLLVRPYTKINKNKTVNKGIAYFITGQHKAPVKVQNTFLRNLRALNLIKNKHIPEIYLTASREARLQLLAGLIDTDGNLTIRASKNSKSGFGGCYFDMQQKNEKLANQIVLLARLLGFKTILTTRKNRPYINKVPGKEATYFRITIKGPIHQIPTKVARKIAPKYHQQNSYTLVPHITEVGVGKYYGFMCDGDHKFLLADGTIVHNSSIFNGLSWCLTGETLNGLKNDDVVNIHTDTGCKVELTFSIDEVEYKVTRYRKYPKLGNNLKIEVNGQDRSGATLSKSEEILESLVPDLTPDLIGSVILLGQGLPHKFSNNSPAGRKELLENLSKSNYMIQDIKNRLAKRDSKLSDLMREQEDLELTTNTKLSMLAAQKQKAIDGLAALENHPDFDTTISQLTQQITDKNTELSAISAKITDLVSQASDLKSKITEILEQNNIKQTNITQSHNDYQTDIRTRMTEAFTKSNALSAEITKLKSIKDICPTCGQKIPGVIKQDTSKQEAEKAELDKLYKDLKEESRLDNENYNKVIAELKQKAAEETRELNLAYNKVNTELGLVQGKQSTLGTEIRNLEIQKTNITNQRDNYLKDKQAFEKTIKDCDSETVTLNESLTYINSKKVDLQDHINVISKMKTLVQRDFRGILLSNVIDFVDMKLKEYCSVVFDTDNVGFKLNGTNIEITFCDKPFEALSGGEKQRVDICLQFAIRDFMSQYLGFSSNILSIDEVFDQLDANACARVLNLISTKLTDVESIYIISHHRDLDIPQDFEITVEKDENGISRIR